MQTYPTTDAVPAAEPARDASRPLAPEALRRPPEEALWAAATGLIYLVFYLVTLQIPSGQMVTVGVTTLVALLLVLLFTVRLARAIRTSAALIINLALSGVLSLPWMLTFLLLPRFPGWSGWRTVGYFLRDYRLIYHTVPGLQQLVMIWLAASVGVAISRVFREMKMLLPAAVALALVDVYVVFGGGLVHQATHGKSEIATRAMQALTVPLAPAHPPTSGAAPMQLTVGFADFLFTALFFACFARFGIPARRTFWLLYAALAIYSGLVFFVKDLALPALVPIAVVVIGANLRRFRYERAEAFALLYAAIIVGAVVAGAAVVSGR